MFLSSYVKIIYDRLEFIEFKQNILLLKQPQHKASVFAQLTLDEFLKIRDYTQEIGLKIKLGEVLTISDYEKNLYEICPILKSYSSSATLVARALLNQDDFDALFSSLN